MALLASALLAPASGADWTRELLSDPTRDEEAPGIWHRNEQGFRLEIVRDTAGGALAIFRLPPGAGDFLDAERAPLLRIDDAPDREAPRVESGLTWVALAAWNGQRDALTGLLRELMSGRRLEVTYFLNGGGYKEAVFDLEGAGAAIADAFGVPAEVDPSALAAARELEAAMFEEGQRCARRKGKKRQACIDEVRSCADSSRSAAELRSCLED